MNKSIKVGLILTGVGVAAEVALVTIGNLFHEVSRNPIIFILQTVLVVGSIVGAFLIPLGVVLVLIGGVLHLLNKKYPQGKASTEVNESHTPVEN